MDAFEKKCALYICDANEVVHFKLSKFVTVPVAFWKYLRICCILVCYVHYYLGNVTQQLGVEMPPIFCSYVTCTVH